MAADGVAEAFERFARHMYEQAPDGWHTAVLSADIVRNGHGGEGVRYLREDGTGIYQPSMDHRAVGPVLVELFHDLAAGERFRNVLAHLTLDAAGRFDAAARFDLRGSNVGNTYTAVLRDGLPPESLDPEPVVADPSYAGDPDRAVTLLHALDQADLNPSPTEEAIAAAEAALGFPLPPDLRALYTVADGGGDDIMDGLRWLTLAELGNADLTSAPQPGGWTTRWDRVVLDAEPFDTVRRATGSPGWIPFAEDYDGNFLAVDLAPARLGRPGQVIRIGNSHADGPEYVADSVTSLLAGAAADPDADAEPVVVGPHSLRPTAQAVRLKGAGIDSAPLAGLRHLRRLWSSGPIDLAPVRHLPVECLQINVGSSLAPLAGHPTLRTLTLWPGATPVTLAPLRDVPNLHGLALAGAATVTDLETVAELTGLWYLELSFDQWQRIRPALDRLDNLHAVTLGGNPTARQAIEWRSFFDSDPHVTARLSRAATGLAG
ncbi:SMI1/KNR4 family protein [Dactylosporangium sp. NPDC006015]|uniref:SMI1/KNR4 family protein n=1 Tax=Dactylosporangium sp. NPDC006015 TaxID=3154576 RepID=UPI0033AA9335